MSEHEAVYSWAVEYAKSNRSTCQASKVKIDTAAVRVGKEVDNPFKPGTRMFLWYLPGPLFDEFRKGSEGKPRIKSLDDVAGIDQLKPDAQLVQFVELCPSQEAQLLEQAKHAESCT